MIAGGPSEWLWLFDQPVGLSIDAHPRGAYFLYSFALIVEVALIKVRQMEGLFLIALPFLFGWSDKARFLRSELVGG